MAALENESWLRTVMKLSPTLELGCSNITPTVLWRHDLPVLCIGSVILVATDAW
jgi:hypothetical protein